MRAVRAADFRTERDSLGTVSVPRAVYYGVHTERALQNFAITGIPISKYPHLVAALASVKQACASANAELGLLSSPRAAAIVKACEEIRQGQLHDHFVVDVVQGGAGTSTNMNANEVIANRGLELMGYERGDYSQLHPIDHVNCSQSTNDVYPTAANLALHYATEDLKGALAILSSTFGARVPDFDKVFKIGRTQLQDAVPMTLGQEFQAIAVSIDKDRASLGEAQSLLTEINLGGTAIGTGLNAHRGYKHLVCRNLSAIIGLPLSSAPNLIEATQDVGALVHLSGVLKRVAIKLSKISSDLRLLSSGPRAGLGEITLPPVQAGSSIMPGKINPVIPEVMNQVAFSVIGNDVTISLAAESGQLQLNAFEPVIVHKLFESLTHLHAATAILAEKCISGITANEDVLRRTVADSIGLAAVLVPYVGYEAASAVAYEALRSNRSVKAVTIERALIPERDIARVFSLGGLTTASLSLTGHAAPCGADE